MADTSRIREGEDWDAFVKRAGGPAATLSELDDVLEVVVDTLGGELKAAKARIAELEAQIANHEHKGPFVAGRAYKRGNFVTYQGSTWYVTRDTMRRPDEENPDGTRDFVLTAKRGRDGKDLR